MSTEEKVVANEETVSTEASTSQPAAQSTTVLERTPKWLRIGLPLALVAVIAGVGGYGYARSHNAGSEQVADAAAMQQQGYDAVAPGYAPVGYAPAYYYGPDYYGYNRGYGRGYGHGYGRGYGRGHATGNFGFNMGGNMDGASDVDGASNVDGANGWHNRGWL